MKEDTCESEERRIVGEMTPDTIKRRMDSDDVVDKGRYLEVTKLKENEKKPTQN